MLIPSDSSAKYLLVFGSAFCLTYLLVPTLILILTRLKIVDQPAARRLNTKPIPRGGGIAVYAGFMMGCSMIFLMPWDPFQAQLDNHWWKSFSYASFVLLLVGLVDDVRGISPLTKLTGQIAAATMLYYFDIRIDSVLGVDLPVAIDFFGTILWYLAITNAFNLIDGLDGLATGLALIAAAGLAGLYLVLRSPGDTLVLLSLMGACLAFLRYNFHPARIFLGDTGSMFLGFTLAAAALGTNTKTSTLAVVGVPFLAMGVPIFDTMLAVWRRGIRRMLAPANSSRSSGIMAADMDHLHHRLLKSGFNQRHAALSLYLASTFMVSIGLFSVVYQSRAIGVFVLSCAIGAFVIVRNLAYIELWDSGTIILRGIGKPSSSILVAIGAPILDAILLGAALAISLVTNKYGVESFNLRLYWLEALPVWCGVPFISLILAHTYSKVWSCARTTDYLLLGGAALGGIVLAWGGSTLLFGDAQAMLNVPVLQFGLLSAVFIVGSRALPSAVRDIMALVASSRSSSMEEQKPSKIILVGAHARTILYIKERSFTAPESRPAEQILGLVDDDHTIRQRWVYGFRVLGTISDLPDLIQRYQIDEVVLTDDPGSYRLQALRELARGRRIKLRRWELKEEWLEPSPVSHTLTVPELDTK